jgi:2-oxoglutarate dehydrogenase E2 component (dihydrolipoamide succinyltransferase)
VTSQLTIPVLNANDDTYVLVEWLVADGAPVSAGDSVALIETSKAVTELVADAEGYLSQAVRPMSSCRPGQVVGNVSAARPAAGSSAQGSTGAEDGGQDPIVTGPAAELMAAEGVPMQAAAALGKKLIRRSDVEALLSRGPQAQARRLPPHQLAVARAVGRSHAAIPAAFTVIKVPADELLNRCRADAARFTGITEHVIKAIAEAALAFPDCVAEVGDDLTITPAASIDVGISIDVGTGLHVPVIRAADTLSVAEIASAMMSFRTRAMRGRLSEHDLRAPRITLTLHTSPGIVFAQPIIYPGQACTLALGAVQTELTLDPAGRPAECGNFYLGLSYDHRVVNGRQAAEFLSAIRDRLAKRQS